MTKKKVPAAAPTPPTDAATDKKPSFDAVAAQEAIQKDRIERVTKCEQAIQQVLAENNCDLDVSVVLRANAIEPTIQVIAR